MKARQMNWGDIERVQADISARKHGGSLESKQAFEKVQVKLPGRRRQVYELVKNAGLRGMTSKELALSTGLPLHSVSGRISELCKALLLEKTSTRRDGAGVVRVKN